MIVSGLKPRLPRLPSTAGVKPCANPSPLNSINREVHSCELHLSFMSETWIFSPHYINLVPHSGQNLAPLVSAPQLGQCVTAGATSIFVPQFGQNFAP